MEPHWGWPGTCVHGAFQRVSLRGWDCPLPSPGGPWMLRCLWVQRGMCWQELQATRPKLWAMDQAQGRAGAEEGTRAKAALTRQLLSPETGRSQRARPTLPCGWALSPRSGGHWLLQGTRAEPSSLDTRHLTQGRHTVSPTIPGVTPSPCREQGGACPQQLQELLPCEPPAQLSLCRLPLPWDPHGEGGGRPQIHLRGQCESGECKGAFSGRPACSPGSGIPDT